MTNALREPFLQAMSRAACTVNIVTTDGPAGHSGATVSAMSSVSADGEAPTLLVCVHHLSATVAAITRNGVLTVNILRDDQTLVSDSFAGRVPAFRDDKFACAGWQAGATGALRLEGALAAFDCRVLDAHRVGTHLIVVATVEAITSAGEGHPPIYTDRAYARATKLSDLPQAAA